MLGLFPVAIIMSGEMAVAERRDHAPRNFFPIVSAGNAAILSGFIFLYIAVAGGSAWSLDPVIWKKD